MLPIVVPLVAAYAINAIRKVYPWAALFLTQRCVEAMIESGASYGLNAIQGAAKGKTLAVNVGSAVIVAGAQRIIDEAPARVIKAAGGPEGIAKRIFRKLDLVDEADAGNTLAPAVERIVATRR